MHLVFWQNILSPHQAPYMRALSELGHEVTVVATESMTADRRALGWKVPDLGRARVVIGPHEAEVRQLIESSPPDSIHIMAGARWTRLGNQAVQHCWALKRRIGIISEAPDPRGLSVCARRAKYTFERFTKGEHYNFVLAMGEIGVRWFRRCGYPARTVFPFAYVSDVVPVSRTNSSAEAVSILYAGQFVVRKGLDALLRAFAAVPSRTARLCLLGAGPEKQPLEALAQELRIQDRITWLANRKSAEVQAEMAQAGLTVLPSRHDGWGAVVNESLMAGTPVICSDSCGAADLICHPWLGTVFHAGHVDDLAKALTRWIDLGPRLQVERDRIRDWTNWISGESVAKYFLAIMQHVYSNSARPVAPWRIQS